MFARLLCAGLFFLPLPAWADAQPVQDETDEPPATAKDADDQLPAPRPLPLKKSLLELREQRQALDNDQAKAAKALQESAADSAISPKLHLRIGELLTRIGSRPSSPKSPEPPKLPSFEKKAVVPEVAPSKVPAASPAAKTPGTFSPENSKPLDPLALAQALYRTGNYDGALRAYQLVPSKNMKAGDRMFVQYGIANCLRNLGKWEEASGIYREIANARDEGNLAQCAQWQLGVMRWHQEMDSQLQDIRKRRQTVQK